MGELRCEVTDFDGPARWRWVLTGPGGRFLGDHDVRLDETDWRYEAFTDLRSYLLWHTAPDRRMEQETRIVAEVGAWLGEQVFGPLGAAMVRERPATVRIVVPAEARTLAFRPFELAHVDRRPLALRNVTLVTQVGAGPRDSEKGVRERLRVLGLFSLPTGHRPLNLRRERQALSRLFQELAAVHGRAVDVRVLQYGATRERLREVLEEDEGWDVVHISGHGEPGELLLEHADGSADPIDAADLTDLLDLARERLSLVSLSSCWSGALTAAEQLRLLKLTPPPALTDERSTAAPAPERPAAALATELVDRLGCAVLAMRFPIIDDFAIDLAEKLYGLLAGKGQPLPRALGTALREVVADPPTPACPPLSVATPALFGAHAVDLRLVAPPRTEPESYDPWGLKLAGLPDQPDRFVGRVGVMARSSGALAPRSGASGVLLHGMPGAGKTACALELAYTHEDAFERLIWFKTPDEGRDITDALTRFAIALESALPGLTFAHLVDDAERLKPFLPRLTELAERRRLLIVADNIESLLTESGGWRDPRWRAVVAALTAHSGLSRLVLTSRRLPEDLDRRIRVEPIDALPLDEALLLARELPALNRLIEGTAEGIDADAAQRLAVRVLESAQGHPKLLELADGQASDPDRLRTLVAIARDTWQRTSVSPESFFRTGVADATGDDYLHALGAWTRTLLGGLAPAERDAFLFLCCVEESDWIGLVLEEVWKPLWARLNRPDEPPPLDEALSRPVRLGMVSRHRAGDSASPSYAVHPGIVAAGRPAAGEAFRRTVDGLMAEWWFRFTSKAEEHEYAATGGGAIARAGIASVPYLMRLGEWKVAGWQLEQTLMRDRARTTLVAMLPLVREIFAATKGTEDEPAIARLHAATLEDIDPQAAERQLLRVREDALAAGRHRLAAAVISDLSRYAQRAGRLSEALAYAEEVVEHGRLAGLGPWTQVSNQVDRLRLQWAIGTAEEVMDETERLWESTLTLPETGDESEGVVVWVCREELLRLREGLAKELGDRERGMELNAEIIASMRQRGAPDHVIADVQLDRCSYLLPLGRVDEVLRLLQKCRLAFEHAQDLSGLAQVLSMLAFVEYNRGRTTVALHLGRDAVRYTYLGRDLWYTGQRHLELGEYLRSNGDQDHAQAHLLAAALIQTITGGDRRRYLRAAAAVLTAPVPADLAELCERVAETPGIDLEELITQLVPDRAAAQDLYARTVAEAWALCLPVTFAAWDPVIAGLVAAVRDDDPVADALLRDTLAEAERSEDWHPLAQRVWRVRAGARGPEVMDGLDPVETAVVRRAIGALNGEVEIPRELWRVMWWGGLLGGLVAACRGQREMAEETRHRLALLAQEPGWAAVAEVLQRILSGARGSALAASLADPVDRAVVATVLHHVNADEPEDA
ncbi:CHAT domain-containing protein [Actinoallomurus rhizosphaericola]|uniref:CHAT domain-containing protein n=1 Tax=Actinoallomurus rhizosphaericola TaxID=2952536 RepID=UPI002093DA9D|nr:CHAT domain-containing protein [Actinoallomurus rhizosphaericola]MCO5996344.1 CHAT domain-containing protein [Actinoallomurus rhizosphaericola]